MYNPKGNNLRSNGHRQDKARNVSKILNRLNNRNVKMLLLLNSRKGNLMHQANNRFKELLYQAKGHLHRFNSSITRHHNSLSIFLLLRHQEVVAAGDKNI